MQEDNQFTRTQVVDVDDEAGEMDTLSNLSTPPATGNDPAIGGAIGLVGGAIVGGVAGGPLGAIIGGVVGAIASDVAIEGVEHLNHESAAQHDYAIEDEDRFSNSGASTPSFDAETGITDHDYTVGDVNATDHTIFGSGSNDIVDESDAPAPAYRSSNPKT